MARVSLTVVAGRVIAYLGVECPGCGRRILDVPQVGIVEARVIGPTGASGCGPVVTCKRCGNLIEVVSHGG